MRHINVVITADDVKYEFPARDVSFTFIITLSQRFTFISHAFKLGDPFLFIFDLCFLYMFARGLLSAWTDLLTCSYVCRR